MDMDAEQLVAGGTAKAEHHERMAQLHAKLSAQHRSISRHYAGGAAGAHEADDDDDDDAAADKEDGDDAAHPFEAGEDVEALDKAATDELELRILKAKAGAGDVTARIRLESLARAELRKALRRPRLAADGAVVGYRGHPFSGG